MEIKLTEGKGRSVYATQDYKPWDVVHEETPILAIINQDRRLNFDQRYSSFLKTFPDRYINKKHAHFKYPLLLLKNGIGYDKIKHLAASPKLEVSSKEIKNVAKFLKSKSCHPFEQAPPTSKFELEQMIRIYRSNGFSIIGLFGDEIGATMFDKTSMFNHSCDPNAFVFTTFNKCYVFARKPIKIGEEITINYVPRGIVNPDSICDFKCQCGFCDSVPYLSPKFFDELQLISTYEERLDFLYIMIDQSEDQIITNALVKLLFETYYDLWMANKNYREKDLEFLLRTVELTPDLVWIEAQLISLAIAYKLDDKEWLKDIKDEIINITNKSEMIEHILLCAELYPHAYHCFLVKALSIL